MKKSLLVLGIVSLAGVSISIGLALWCTSTNIKVFNPTDFLLNPIFFGALEIIAYSIGTLVGIASIATYFTKKPSVIQTKIVAIGANVLLVAAPVGGIHFTYELHDLYKKTQVASKIIASSNNKVAQVIGGAAKGLIESTQNDLIRTALDTPLSELHWCSQYVGVPILATILLPCIILAVLVRLVGSYHTSNLYNNTDRSGRNDAKDYEVDSSEVESLITDDYVGHQRGAVTRDNTNDIEVGVTPTNSPKNLNFSGEADASPIRFHDRGGFNHK